MSLLHDKITSYTHERAIEMNETQSNTPTRTGTATNGTWSVNNRSATFESADGPFGGAGSWQFNLSTSPGNNATFSSSTANAEYDGFVDGLFTVGFWFKLDTLPTGTAVHNLWNVGSTNYIRVGGTTNSVGASKLIFNFGSGVQSPMTTTLQSNRWYFVAVRRFANTANSLQYWLDGNLLFTASSTTIQAVTTMTFGSTATNSVNTTYNISNYFHGSPSIYTATAIQEIWTAGSTAPTLNINADPMLTTSLTFVDPTTLAGSDIAVIADPMIADNGHFPESIITTDFNAVIGTEVFTASGLLVDPFVIAYAPDRNISAAPMTGNLDIVMPNLNVPQTYYGRVISKNPIFYIKDGAETTSGVINYGSQPFATPTKGTAVTGGTATSPFIAIDEGKSFKRTSGSVGSGDTWLRYNNSSARTSMNSLLATKNFTIEYWAKRANAYGGTNTIYPFFEFRNGTSTTSTQTNIVSFAPINNAAAGSATTNYRIRIKGSNVTQDITHSMPLVSDAWHHFVITFGPNAVNPTTQSDVKLYIDNVVVKSQTITTPTFNDSLTEINFNMLWTHSEFDEVAIYPTALTPNQVSENYEYINAAGPDRKINVLPVIATAQFNENIIISTGRQVNFGAPVFTANTLMVDNRPYEFFTASALMPDHKATVAPNYQSIIKAQEPFYYIYDGQSNPFNWGYTAATVTLDNVTANVLSDGKLEVAGDTKSWASSSQNAFQIPQINVDFGSTTVLQELYDTRSLSIEMWYTSRGERENTGHFYFDGVTRLGEVYGGVRRWTGNFDENGIPIYEFVNDTKLIIGEIQATPGNTFESSAYAYRSYPCNPLPGDWNHLVVVYSPAAQIDDIVRKIYLNGNIIGNETFNIAQNSFVIPGSNPPTTQYIPENLDTTTAGDTAILFGAAQLTGSQNIRAGQGVKLDEFVIYDKSLTNSQVINNFSYINNLSPDFNYNTGVLDINIYSGDNSFLAIRNVSVDGIFENVSSQMVDPTIFTQTNINLAVDAMTASSELVDPVIRYSTTISVEIMVAQAEKPPAFRLNQVYYNYVIANRNPYRYVTFDAADTYLDYGTDNDYSVLPITYGGTIVNPGTSINGKSLKTNGTSFITDGLILKESEWNDSWGTGQNSYHSAFWFKRADDDNSTTGLRVLWNLNGYKDNQHVVIYQYQDKIHAQFNNGSGTWIEQDTGTLNLFDYERHLVVIDFDHTNNNNNVVKLYVDAVLKMTVNLGSYTGTTTNASSADSGPNDENNNHPRLSVGCLITPFGSTALPVQPTNTKLIIDEVHWAKTSVTQQNVTDLFNAMATQVDKEIQPEPMTSSALIVNPATSIGINKGGGSMAASSEFIESVVTAIRNVQINADAFISNAELINAVRSDFINYVADLFIATISFANAANSVTRIADPMIATALLQNRSIPTQSTPLAGKSYPIMLFLNGATTGKRTIDSYNAWIQYVRSTSIDNIFSMKEVK
jgi:hypothetical protein